MGSDAMSYIPNFIKIGGSGTQKLTGGDTQSLYSFNIFSGKLLLQQDIHMHHTQILESL
jgi:hypothetical protein